MLLSQGGDSFWIIYMCLTVFQLSSNNCPQQLDSTRLGRPIIGGPGSTSLHEEEMQNQGNKFSKGSKGRNYKCQGSKCNSCKATKEGASNRKPPYIYRCSRYPINTNDHGKSKNEMTSKEWKKLYEKELVYQPRKRMRRSKNWKYKRVGKEPVSHNARREIVC